MELKSHFSGQIAVLELGGRFDTYETAAVAEWLQNTAAAIPAQIVVNMSEVKFIDSTGLATLVQGMKHCRQHGGDLYLCALQQPVQVIFKLTRLDKAFKIFGSEAEALSAFTL